MLFRHCLHGLEHDVTMQPCVEAQNWWRTLRPRSYAGLSCHSGRYSAEHSAALNRQREHSARVLRMRRSMTTREEVLAVAERWRTKGGTAEQGAAAHGRMETAGSGGAAGKAGARGGGSRGLGRQFASRRAPAATAVRVS